MKLYSWLCCILDITPEFNWVARIPATYLSTLAKICRLDINLGAVPERDILHNITVGWKLVGWHSTARRPLESRLPESTEITNSEA